MSNVLLPRATNKTPEQILRESRQRQEAEIRPPKQQATEYRIRRRKEFEDRIRRNGMNGNIQVWAEYTQWEESQRDYARARNVWERAIERLPRVDQVWYKYINMEEMLGNIPGARLILERWMSWSPDQQAWLSFVEFELRYNEIERARSIYKSALDRIPKERAEDLYSKFLAFEKQYGNKEDAIVGLYLSMD